MSVTGDMIECNGECDYCRHKRTVPGTDERIDREPSYYCSMSVKTSAMSANELIAYNAGFNDALDRVEELLRREQRAERLHNTAGTKAGERIF